MELFHPADLVLVIVDVQFLQQAEEGARGRPYDQVGVFLLYLLPGSSSIFGLREVPPVREVHRRPWPESMLPSNFIDSFRRIHLRDVDAQDGRRNDAPVDLLFCFLMKGVNAHTVFNWCHGFIGTIDNPSYLKFISDFGITSPLDCRWAFRSPDSSVRLSARQLLQLLVVLVLDVLHVHDLGLHVHLVNNRLVVLDRLHVLGLLSDVRVFLLNDIFNDLRRPEVQSFFCLLQSFFSNFGLLHCGLKTSPALFRVIPSLSMSQLQRLATLTTNCISILFEICWSQSRSPWNHRRCRFIIIPGQGT